MDSGVDLSDAVDLSNDGVPYVLTSAGRWPNESKDCVVIALSIATGFSYELIHELFRVCVNRPTGEGLSYPDTLSRYLPFRIRLMNTRRYRLHKIVDYFPVGRYLVGLAPRKTPTGKSGHLMALVDGKLYERYLESPDSVVTHVWKVFGIKARDYLGNKI